MAVEYQILATLEIDGVEADYEVKASMNLEPNAGPGGWGAVIDGDIEARVNGNWTDFDELDIDVRTRNSVEEALSQVAFDDDGCDPDEYDGDR